MSAVACVVRDLSKHAVNLVNKTFVIYMYEDGSGGHIYPENPMAYAIITSLFEAGEQFFSTIFPKSVRVKVKGTSLLLRVKWRSLLMRME